jgi:hypothetical protein
VTADKAALILSNSTLTVNGTVNAGPNHIRMGGSASRATIAGSGTIRLREQGNLLSVDGNKKKLTLDGVTLVGIPDNNEPLVRVGRGGEFILKSGAITGNTHVGNEWAEGGGVKVNEGGTFTMEGGEISGNSAKGGTDGSSGGGVSVRKGTFTMSGGTITGNSAISGGAGVFVEDAGSTFTMQGGTISANTATGGIDGSSGGGVRLGSGSTFIMEGGTIYGKAASLPAGTAASLANSARYSASLEVHKATAKWGTGGTYKGGASPTGGGDIVNFNPNNDGGTDDTLIATK